MTELKQGLNLTEAKRKLATVQVIKEVKPIEDADAIEVATVKSWSVVVKKGEVTPGQKVIYFEIDSLLPVVPEFEFLDGVLHPRWVVLHQCREPFCILISTPSRCQIACRDEKQL